MCEDFKSKSSCFDELRYSYMKWYLNKTKDNWNDFLYLCNEHLSLPETVNMEWLRNLVGR